MLGTPARIIVLDRVQDLPDFGEAVAVVAGLVPSDTALRPVDHLRGLKENVIMGRLIPAGTGMEFYRKIKIPDEVIEGLGETGMEGEYTAEYLVEPEHIREGVAEV